MMARDGSYNFSAGPSVLPDSALERAKAELLDYKGSGMSVMELSHRSALFQEIFQETKEKFRAALRVPESHEILFLQGGATLQFAAIPMNLMAGGGADYAITGSFSQKAAREAEKYGPVRVAASSESTGFDRIPRQEELRLDDAARYFYYCANNTIYGTAWDYVPRTAAPLVCDMSSELLSKPVDLSRYGLVYAGAQKNMAPAGLTVLILDRSLTGREQPDTPQLMSYQVMVDNDSLLNTPPCWCIYLLGLVLDWLAEQGGVEAMAERKAERAALIYRHLDESRLFKAHALPGSRSEMNVCFRTGSEALDAAFLAGAEKRGLKGLKGHKLTGGIRASLYNAMPLAGARALAQYMKEFEQEHV